MKGLGSISSIGRIFASLYAIAKEEFLYLIKGRPPVALVPFIVPLGFAVLFGLIYQENVVNHIPMVVWDEDQSATSRSLIEAYTDADRFTFVAQVSDEASMREAIHDGEARVALAIPRNFDKDLKSGRGADFMLMVDSSNNMFGNAAISASQEVSRSFSVAAGQQLLESQGLLPDDAINSVYPVRMGVRILGNPANGYSSFMLSGLMMNGLQIGVMLSLAPALVTELLQPRWRRKHPFLILVGKSIPYWLLSFAAYLLSLYLIIHVFAVPMRGSWGEAMLLGASFIFFVSSVLHIFSSCCPSRVLSLQAPMVYIMPGLLYSGLSWPNFDMSSIASVLGMLMPMTYGGDTLRDILLNGTAPTLYTNCKIMLLGGLGCQLVAAGLFYLRRRFHIWTDESGASGLSGKNEGKGEHDETSAGNEA